MGAREGRSEDLTARDRVAPLFDLSRARTTYHDLAGAIQVTLIGVCIWCWTEGWWPVCVVLWGVIAWMSHGALTRLHEAAHGLIHKTRWRNEAHGTFIGIMALIPLSVYRHAHHLHHAHLGRPQDPELWPYNQTDAPRVVRIVFAWSELLLGWIVTPALYSSHSVRTWNEIRPATRRRLTLDWVLMAVFWGALVTVVSVFHWWEYFLVGFLIPAWLAGTMQTIRKFTEHMGLTGDTILGLTRSVAHERLIGKAASRSQLHVDHHGAHHRWARIPYYNLPSATEVAYASGNEGPIFSNYFAAMADMLPHLLDPKVGPQWREASVVVEVKDASERREGVGV